MRLLLVRHAESVGNAAGIIQGRADHPLSARGERQAALLAERLASGPPFDALYASPLARADGTARAIAQLSGHAIQPLPEAMEYDFGEVNGMTFREAGERYPANAGNFPIYPGEEGRPQFNERVRGAFLSLAIDHPEKSIVVVTHGGPIVAFTLAMLGRPYRRPIPFSIHNASITVFDVNAGQATLIGLNDTCHLAAMDRD
jgi:broad specificity phosphatase PhoE